MRFRKLPVEIEARPVPVYQEGMEEADYKKEMSELAAWCGGTELWSRVRPRAISIQTLEGIMQANPGDWIVCGVKGEFYPIRDDILRLSYEPVLEVTEDEVIAFAQAIDEGTDKLLSDLGLEKE